MVLLSYQENSASSSSGCQDHPMYRVACPVWKQEYGCTGVRRRTWHDSINSLCPKTCGLCGNVNSILSLPCILGSVFLQCSAMCPTKSCNCFQSALCERFSVILKESQILTSLTQPQVMVYYKHGCHLPYLPSVIYFPFAGVSCSDTSNFQGGNLLFKIYIAIQSLVV